MIAGRFRHCFEGDNRRTLGALGHLGWCAAGWLKNEGRSKRARLKSGCGWARLGLEALAVCGSHDMVMSFENARAF